MNFYPLTAVTTDVHILKTEYQAAKEIGVIRLGENNLFFRKSLKIYYVPYADISRCFRRVMSVPAKLCCGKGDFEIENLVICVEDVEIAQIQLPGTRAAKALIDELKLLMPHAQFTYSSDDSDMTKETQE